MGGFICILPIYPPIPQKYHVQLLKLKQNKPKKTLGIIIDIFLSVISTFQDIIFILTPIHMSTLSPFAPNRVVITV